MTKPTKWVCAQRRLRSGWASAQSEPSLCAQWVAKDPSFFHADSEDWLDWVDAQADLSLCWPHTHFVGFVMSWLISMYLTWRQITCRNVSFTVLYNHWKVVIEPAHEIMALFVLRKLILQTSMRSHPMGLDVWFLVVPFVYFHTLCVRTAKALASSFTGRLCDKYHILTSWLNDFHWLTSGFTLLAEIDFDAKHKSLKGKMSRDMTKPTKWLCTQRRLRSAWASAQSDQSLRCALNG